MSEHEPRVIVTHASGWTLDNGVKVPAHDLHRFACSCGWEGAASYAQKTKAEAHWQRHVEQVTA